MQRKNRSKENILKGKEGTSDLIHQWKDIYLKSFIMYVA